MGKFGFVVFKVILESFGAFCSKWHGTRKRRVAERSGVKFRPQDTSNTQWGKFDLVIVKVILRSHTLSQKSCP